MLFSLVIPCFNEAKNIPLILERCGALVARGGIEVVLVDNGSVDNTSEIMTKLLPLYPGCRMISVPENQGYGHGILQGLYAAKGNILGWTHADMQTDPCDVVAGLNYFNENSGENIFVKGRRYGRPFLMFYLR